MKSHFMLDIETLGTKPGCPVLSIACKIFAIEREGKFSTAFLNNETFYSEVHLANQMEDFPNLRIDPKTMIWWMGQSESARSVFQNNSSKCRLSFAIGELSRYIYETKFSMEVVIWARDPDFDCAILEHFYDEIGDAYPWKYSNKRSHRTLLDLAGVTHVASSDAHHAVSDVNAQIESAVLALRTLGKIA